MTEIWKNGFFHLGHQNLQNMAKIFHFHFSTQFDWNFYYELNEVRHSIIRQLFLKLWQKTDFLMTEIWKNGFCQKVDIYKRNFRHYLAKMVI